MALHSLRYTRLQTAELALKRTLCHIAGYLFLLMFTAVGMAEYLSWGYDDPSDDAAIVSLYRSTEKVVAHRARPRTQKHIPEEGLAVEDSKSPALRPVLRVTKTGQELLYLLSLQRK